MLIQSIEHAAIVRRDLLFELFDLKQFNIQYSGILSHILSPPGTVESQLVSCQSFRF